MKKLGAGVMILMCMIGFQSVAFGASKGQAKPVKSAVQPTIRTTPGEQMPRYTVGDGSRYKMDMATGPVDVTIGVVESSPTRLVIEVQIESPQGNAMLPIKMVQQFHMGLRNGKVALLKGLMKIPQFEKAQVLPAEFMQGFDGVKMRSFLMGSKMELDAHKIGLEKVKAADGKTYTAEHYQNAGQGQTVDFWVADTLKPLGIVKMSSAGSKADHNYKMLFNGRVTSYKKQIDASKAEPLNDLAKMFLPLLGASSPLL